MMPVKSPVCGAGKYGEISLKEPLINCLCERIAALRGARNLDYLCDMSRFLRSVRLTLHPAQIINQRFLRNRCRDISETVCSARCRT